jgi:acetyltransferase-like isoleucine patch superfamily enzyme
MKDNIPTAAALSEDGRIYIDYDWYDGGIPSNVSFGSDVYLDTAYGFALYCSEHEPGLSLGDATGAYDRTSFVVGARGRIEVGDYTILNGTYLVSNERIRIGSHCLIAWGSVITDSWVGLAHAPLEARRRILGEAAADPLRRLQPLAAPRPVTLEDNTWVGFDSVILPGVTLGRGSIVGCKTVVAEDVPPYAVVAGDPARIIRYLEPDDTPEARAQALRQFAR